MARSETVRMMEAYKKVSEQIKALEEKKGGLKSDILLEMEARGVKEMTAGEYVATITTYDRESVALAELVKEFGRDLLKEKKLLNSYPVTQLKVTKA